MVDLEAGHSHGSASNGTPQQQHGLSNTTSSASNKTSTEAQDSLRRTRTQRFRTELRRITLHFTPSWFSMTMGTGITSILLHQLPYQFNGLGIISNVVFGLNVFLFLLFLAITTARYVIWPQLFWIMLFHPSQSLFLGCFPMGMATIISMCALSAAPAWNSTSFTNFVWAAWWLNVAISLSICIGLPFIQFTRHVQSLDKITGVWFLPVVSTIVCSSAGGLVAQILPPAHARLTITVCYVLWGSGFGMAFLLMSLYYARQAIYKIPPAQVIVSTFNPLGPCGQGAFVILQLSSVIYKMSLTDNAALASPNAANAETARMMAVAIYAVSVPVALVIWGLGLVWLILAVASIIDLWWVSELTFNLSAFSLVFPLGVFASAAIKLGMVLDSGGWKVVGTILSLITLILWASVSTATLYKVVRGELIFSPCLAEMCDDNGEPPKYVPQARKYDFEPRPEQEDYFGGNDGDSNTEADSRSRSRQRGRTGPETPLSKAKRWITSPSPSPFGRSRSRGNSSHRVATQAAATSSQTTVQEGSSSVGGSSSS